MRSSCSIVFFLLALLLARVEAHSLLYEDGTGVPLFTAKIPPGWSVRVETRWLDMLSESEDDWIGAWKSTHFQNLESGNAYFHTFFDGLYSDYQIEEPEKVSLKGMPAIFYRGWGVRQGSREWFSLLLFEPRPETLCFAIRLSRHEGRSALLKSIISPVPKAP